MYSVVLVMALAGSAEAPDCHHTSCGCQGVVSYGCAPCQGVSYGCAPCQGFGRVGCLGCCGLRIGCNGCTGYMGCTGCTGYTGCYGGQSGCYGGGGVIVTPAKTMPQGEKIDAPKKDASVPTPGTIVVTLPADAKLSIDGYVSNQTSGQRRLVTPAIQPGQEFTYTLVAETTQNGQAVSQTQLVTVRAGQQTPVSFNFSTIPTAASR